MQGPKATTGARADSFPRHMDHTTGLLRPAFDDPLAGVALAGALTPEQLAAAISSGAKSWLYLNPECKAEESGLKPALASAGLPCACFEVDKDALTIEVAVATVAALTALPQPAVIQCSTATRAGAVLLLALAQSRRLNYKAAMQLASDLQLGFADGWKADEPPASPLVSWVMATTAAWVAATDWLPSPEGCRIAQLFDDTGSSTYTYLVADISTETCALIDPVLEQVERDLAAVDAAGLCLTHVINTHAHADHITGSGRIKQLRPEVKSVISVASTAKADTTVCDGDVITFGSTSLRVIATSGHTEGCVCYHLPGRSSSSSSSSSSSADAATATIESAGWLFSGDTLLIRGCGRTDFQGGSAETLFASVHQQIFSALHPSTVLAPAHDYRGRNLSSVGDERRWNPRLHSNMELESFVTIMADLNLAYPKKMDMAVPANLMCGGL